MYLLLFALIAIVILLPRLVPLISSSLHRTSSRPTPRKIQPYSYPLWRHQHSSYSAPLGHRVPSSTPLVHSNSVRYRPSPPTLTSNRMALAPTSYGLSSVNSKAPNGSMRWQGSPRPPVDSLVELRRKPLNYDTSDMIPLPPIGAPLVRLNPETRGTKRRIGKVEANHLARSSKRKRRCAAKVTSSGCEAQYSVPLRRAEFRGNERYQRYGKPFAPCPVVKPPFPTGKLFLSTLEPVKFDEAAMKSTAQAASVDCMHCCSIWW